MNRSQLAHALRAAADLLGDREFVVIGSAAIFGSYSDVRMNEDLAISVEVDLVPPGDEAETKAVELDGAQGELSDFHETHGFYIDGVSATTAKMPAGWQQRVVAFAPRAANGTIGWCLSPSDLVATKTAAGRQKDLRFATAAFRQRLVDPDEVLVQIPSIEASSEQRERAMKFVTSHRTLQPGTMKPTLDTSGITDLPDFDAASFGMTILANAETFAERPPTI